MIKCPNCTGELIYDTTLGKVKCVYCGSTFSASELRAKVTMSGEVMNEESVPQSVPDEKEKYSGKAYTCSQCGATLLTFDETAITFCSYCGSQAMLEDKMMEVNSPDFIIPFKKSKDECVSAYKRKVSSFFFAPNYMKSDFLVEKFRGIYMPYGIFDVRNNGPIYSKGEKYLRRWGDYVYYGDYVVKTDANISYYGLSYDLVSKFYDNYSTAIPYDIKDAVPFNANYMTGYYADSLDVSDDIYKDDAQAIVDKDVLKKLRKNHYYKIYNCKEITMDPICDKKIGMFPTYFLAIRNPKKDLINYAVINGQTGKVIADLPVDFSKYIIISLIVSLIIFLIINPYLILTPIKVSVFAIIAGIISAIISRKQIKKIMVRETHEDDQGVEFASGGLNLIKNYYSKKKRKDHLFKYMYKELLAIIIPLFPIIAQVVDDSHYYISAFVSLVLIILSFYDLVKEHNLLVSNKLPQLEKRGGDENA